MDKVPMTAEGANALREEMNRLKSVERPRIVQEISEALEQGDLRENAEYQYAKEEQGLIEARISEIAGKLSAAQIIDIRAIPPTGKVIFGLISLQPNCTCFLLHWSASPKRRTGVTRYAALWCPDFPLFL
jgi:transcription elongation factor GreA